MFGGGDLGGGGVNLKRVVREDWETVSVIDSELLARCREDEGRHTGLVEHCAPGWEGFG